MKDIHDDYGAGRSPDDPLDRAFLAAYRRYGGNADGDVVEVIAESIASAADRQEYTEAEVRSYVRRRIIALEKP